MSKVHFDNRLLAANFYGILNILEQFLPFKRAPSMIKHNMMVANIFLNLIFLLLKKFSSTVTFFCDHFSIYIIVQ